MAAVAWDFDLIDEAHKRGGNSKYLSAWVQKPLSSSGLLRKVEKRWQKLAKVGKS